MVRAQLDLALGCERSRDEQVWFDQMLHNYHVDDQGRLERPLGVLPRVVVFGERVALGLVESFHVKLGPPAAAAARGVRR